jgi:hypothetical protein
VDIVRLAEFDTKTINGSAKELKCSVCGFRRLMASNNTPLMPRRNLVKIISSENLLLEAIFFKETGVGGGKVAE